MSDCIFCKIINKELPAHIVYEDNDVLAILPKDMEIYGHTLVIPKRHFENIYDIDESILKNIIVAVKNLSIKYTAKIWSTGINILHASWKDAQQSVFHFHFHIFPRFNGDSLDTWPKLPPIEIDKDQFLKRIS